MRPKNVLIKKGVPKNVCWDLFFFITSGLYGPPEIVSKLIYDRALSRTKFGNATRRKRTRCLYAQGLAAVLYYQQQARP